MSISIQPQHQQLLVVQKAKDLVILVYTFTRSLPDSEKFGLISQMQRAAVSIPSNLAEGQQRGDKEFIHFVNIARGSLAELRVQLEITERLYGTAWDGSGKIIDEILLQKMYDLLEEVGKMSYSLLLKLKSDASHRQVKR